MANPSNPDEIVMTSAAAKPAGRPRWFQTSARLLHSGTAGRPSGNWRPDHKNPRLTVNARVVGLVVSNSEVVHDDIDRYPTFMLYTPALTMTIKTAAAPVTKDGPSTAIPTRSGNADVADVEQEIGDAFTQNQLSCCSPTPQ